MRRIRVPDRIGKKVRLDRFLAEQLPGVSRAHIQRGISGGNIRVNGERVKPHRFLRAGDVIAFSDPPLQSGRTVPERFDETALIHEEEHFAVVNKPTGVLVHPAPQSNEQTLCDWLRVHIPATAAVGNAGRPGIVHRLDRAVSGALLVAKTPEAFNALREAFRLRKVEKRYTAIVSGVLPNDEGVINFAIRRSKTAGRMASVPARERASKHAETRYRVRERLTHATRVDVRLITGRSHQIRVHFYALGHPVLGDSLYRAKEVPKVPLKRLYLHASALAFPLFGAVHGPFTAPLPESFTEILKALRQRPNFP